MDPRGGRGPSARPKSKVPPPPPPSNTDRRSRAESQQQQQQQQRAARKPDKDSKDKKAAAAAGPDVFWSDDGETNPSVFTFYREGTPPPPADRKPRFSAPPPPPPPGGQYVGPELDLAAIGLADTEKKTRKQKRWSFTVIAATIFLVVALAVGVGVGIGVSRSISHGESTSFTAPSSTPPTPAQTNTASSPTTSASGGTTTTTAAPVNDCPGVNGTVYRVPGSDKSFLRVCGVDFSGTDGAVDLRNVPTSSFSQCMNNCAGTIGCTGCAWGYVPGDTTGGGGGGGEHRCWMKSTLRKSHAAQSDFCFGILQ